MYVLRMSIRISIFLLTLQGSLCLRDVKMLVPEAVERGSKVEMQCLYDLEQEVLYSVKWYRGEREFCRYSPRDVPPLKIFPIKGITVDKDESDSKRLTIANATHVAKGRYTCEVSTEAPSFQTVEVQSFMYVVDLPPATYPSMTGIRRRYKPGMKLRAECVSRNSMPAANLSFFINNEPASTQHVWHRVDSDQEGLMTAYANLLFVVQKHHFVREKIKVRCTAIIYNIYRKSIEKSTEEEKVRTTPASLPEIHKAVKYAVHRLPDTNNSVAHRMTSSASNKIVPIILLILPTVLR